MRWPGERQQNREPGRSSRVGVISVLAIVAGVVVGAFHGNVGAVFAIVTGAVGGIVAIVLRTSDKNGH